ncbi:hypothetical protein F4782DRAFT_551253, partial [Xylaria castorea]
DDSILLLRGRCFYLDLPVHLVFPDPDERRGTMISIQFHLPALLVLAAMLALGNSVNLLDDIPVNTIMDEGTTSVFKWEWDGDATGVGQLDMSSFRIGDLSSGMDYQLEGITYSDGYQSTSGRSFRIKAKPSLSTTSATRNATSTTTSASGAGMETSATDQQQMSGDSSSPTKISAGTLAGIIVGVIAGVVIFATLIGLVVYYRRKAIREKKDLKKTSDVGSGLGADAKKKKGPRCRYDRGAVFQAGAGGRSWGREGVLSRAGRRAPPDSGGRRIF